jgi:hypothetical protein
MKSYWCEYPAGIVAGLGDGGAAGGFGSDGNA